MASRSSHVAAANGSPANGEVALTIGSMTHKQVAYVLLRITLGALFLVYGLEKLHAGPSMFAKGMVEQFAKTPLPPFSVRLFAFVLPFAEAGLGFCVLTGFFTRIVLAFTALLLLALTFGQAVIPNPSVVASNLIYCVVAFLLLFFAEHNAFAIEGLWQKKAGK
jgi:uncharacterized membrane protein YphA (DoxX/SURF4 family)